MNVKHSPFRQYLHDCRTLRLLPLKSLLVCLGVLLLAAGAESASVMSILSKQAQLNAHLTELQKSVETELADIHLDSSEIAQRHDQLAELARTLSDDMLEWGYTDPEREDYTQTLQEIDTL